MRIRPAALVAVLSLSLGCQSTYQQSASHGAPAELCNTPGRQALAEQIVARGGILRTDGIDWDNSVDAATKEKMGHPLSDVVLPQDKFSAQDIAAAQLLFPEAKVTAPLTLEGSEDDPDRPSDD